MRFYGAVGYATSVEATPGVWTDVITEINYFGDVIRATRRLDPPFSVPPTLNSNLSLENQFSVLADAMAYDNFRNIRYVRWENTNWTVTSAEIVRPRLTLTIGEPWNGSTA